MSERTVENIDWEKEFYVKKDLMEERGYTPTDPYVFYRELFPPGYLSDGEHQRDWKGSAILTQIRKSDEFTRSRQWIIDDDLKMLDKLMGDPFGLLPPLSFFGKSHKKKNAHELYAYAIDIDYVGVDQLKNLLKQFNNGPRLCPTYLVSSGKGMHLYYFLDSPIILYRYREEMLSELKKEMIRCLWGDSTSLKPYNPDITGIYQGFRGVGSQTKFGGDARVTAYKLCDNRYNIYDLKASVPYCTVDLSDFEIWTPPEDEPPTTPLDQAKELWPDWYQRRIIEGEKAQPTGLGEDGHCWKCKPDLYEWWKRKIYREAKVGGRYYSILALCAYGLKCNIPDEQIKEDAYSLKDFLESLTETEDNHFLDSDIVDALKSLKGDRRGMTRMATRQWIEDHTKIPIPPNKRNFLKQDLHLRLARNRKEILKEVGQMNPEGRPNKKKEVVKWRSVHPNGSKKQCQRETGLSIHTVRKWWDEPVPKREINYKRKQDQIIVKAPPNVIPNGLTQEEMDKFLDDLDD